MSDDGLTEFARDLGIYTQEVSRRVERVVRDSSKNVRKMGAQFSSGISHAPRYPRSITQTVKRTDTGWFGEIGPEQTAANQGFLGRTLELGNATTPPMAHMGPAGDREGPVFMENLEAATRFP